MPNIKSAIKRTKTNETRRIRNAGQKSSLRASIKSVENAAANQESNAKELLQSAIKKLDKAVSKGLLHKNTAARKKSRLTKKINSL